MLRERLFHSLQVIQIVQRPSEACNLVMHYCLQQPNEGYPVPTCIGQSLLAGRPSFLRMIVYIQSSGSQVLHRHTPMALLMQSSDMQTKVW